jgi:hypothetical protein
VAGTGGGKKLKKEGGEMKREEWIRRNLPVKCNWCEDRVPLKSAVDDPKGGYFCWDCYARNFYKCKKCGELQLRWYRSELHEICPICARNSEEEENF